MCEIKAILLLSIAGEMLLFPFYHIHRYKSCRDGEEGGGKMECEPGKKYFTVIIKSIREIKVILFLLIAGKTALLTLYQIHAHKSYSNVDREKKKKIIQY